MFRYLIIFILGFLLTYLFKDSFFDEYNMIFSIFLRTLFALFFVFVIWLVQNKK
ncbi:Uncharacterised protein [Kurthia zopfii]|nr:Uncharacterised protein [Kurthia zopfii]